MPLLTRWLHLTSRLTTCLRRMATRQEDRLVNHERRKTSPRLMTFRVSIERASVPAPPTRVCMTQRPNDRVIEKFVVGIRILQAAVGSIRLGIE